MGYEGRHDLRYVFEPDVQGPTQRSEPSDHTGRAARSLGILPIKSDRPIDDVAVPTRFKALDSDAALVLRFYGRLDVSAVARLNDTKSYTTPQKLSELMGGGTVGVVVESRNASWQPGETVLAGFGWQDYGMSDGSGMRKVDTTHVPASGYLGAVGMPGVTAWYGVNRICALKPEKTVAASGAVGSVVGQLAKRHGCRVMGITGGAAKCAHVVDELGFTPAWTIRRVTSRTGSRQRPRTGWTGTSKTWAGRWWMR